MSNLTAQAGANITPNDNLDLERHPWGINVATAGNVKVTTVKGSTFTVFLAAGHIFHIRAKRIWHTGTTATGICILY